MQTLTVRVNETTEKARADPAAGVATPTVTATLPNGHARLSSGPFNWESDLGPGIGGVFLRDTLAPQFGVTLDDVQATARCRSDAAGLLGIEGTNPGPQQIELSIVVSSPDPADRLDAMFAAWRERGPIYLSLLSPNTVAVDFPVGVPTAAG